MPNPTQQDAKIMAHNTVLRCLLMVYAGSQKEEGFSAAMANFHGFCADQVEKIHSSIPNERDTELFQSMVISEVDAIFSGLVK